MRRETSCFTRVRLFSNSPLPITYRRRAQHRKPLHHLRRTISHRTTSVSVRHLICCSRRHPPSFGLLIHPSRFLALESRTTVHKSAKGPICIAECDPQGKFVIIENTSRSKTIALANWTLQQEDDNGETLKYTLPDNCLLKPNHTFKVRFRVPLPRHDLPMRRSPLGQIFTKSHAAERRNSDHVASLVSSWHTGANVVTTLINAEGKVTMPRSRVAQPTNDTIVVDRLDLSASS